MDLNALIDKLIFKKPEYGTPEYWKKERRSKFVRDYRKKEQRRRDMVGGIVGLWAHTIKPEMPLYSLMSNT